jgi:hypothetical protein
MLAIWKTGMPPSAGELVTTKPSSRAGAVNVINADGSVMSVQPDGSVETRPSGTDGAWEQACVNGSWIVFAPNGVPFAFPIFSQVPA